MPVPFLVTFHYHMKLYARFFLQTQNGGRPRSTFLNILKLHTASHKKAKSGIGGLIEHTCDRGNCGKKFNRDHALQNHLNMHDNILYKCHFCPWTGVRSLDPHIVLHLNSHFGLRPYNCFQCGAKFLQESARVKHERVVHEKIKPIRKCGSCDFETLSLTAYNKHLETCVKRK